MRISNNLFLAKANLKGSKKKNTVMVMMILSVISITLLVGFLTVSRRITNVEKLNCKRKAQRQIALLLA